MLTEQGKASRAAWAKAHPEKVRGYKRKWREANREKQNAASLQWYYDNHERCCARVRNWAANNPDKVRASGRRHDTKPHRKSIQRGDYKARQRRYQKRHLEKVRARRRAYQAKRRAVPVQRTIDAIQRRMRLVIRGKSKGAFALLGYTANELKEHLASQFQPGMTWDNYGLYGQKWHIDHKRSVCTFKLPDELVECFSLQNLQPLWARDNLAKPKRSY
jgi:hypothetical protein